MNLCLSIRHFFFLCICTFFIAFSAGDAKADAKTYHAVSVVASKDSLVAAENENILTNSITLTNVSKKFQRVIIRTAIPDGWRNLSKSRYLEGDDLYYNLYPGQVVKIPVNLLRLPTASPHWTNVSFLVWNREMNADSQRYFYSVKTLERKSYTSSPRNLVMEVGKDSKVLAPVLYLKNTGNIEDVYVIKYYNSALNIDDSVVIKLPPGTDSTYTHTVPLKNSQINNLISDKLSVSVHNSENSRAGYNYTMHHYADENKYNSSPYSEMPIRIEGGYMVNGIRNSYYGAASGQLSLGQGRSLDFKYRSKQYSNIPTGIQRNIFMLHYRDKNFNIIAGQISMPQYFVNSLYRGLSVGYQRKGFGIRVMGTKHDPVMYIKNDNVATELTYGIGKIGITNTLLYNNSITDSVRSYIFTNDIKLFASKNFRMDVQAGVGFDKYSENDPRIQDDHRPGLMGGYNLTYAKGHLHISSRINYMDRFFPGIRKGATNQMHNITWKYKKGQAGVFYAADYRQVNYFRDSLFNSDILTYNNSRLGVRINNTFGKINTVLSGGLMKQNGPQGLLGVGDAYFADIAGTYLYKKWLANLAIQTVYSQPVADGKVPMTFVSSANVNSRYFTFNAVYTRIPMLEGEGSDRMLSGYTETINGGPQLNFYMFRNRLFGSVRYNISKSSLDKFFTSGVGGSLGYNNPKHGLGVNFTGFVPLREQTNDPGLPIENRLMAQLSIVKQLNVPVFLKRKYYTMRIITYEDVNGNHIMDEGEPEVDGVKMLINGLPFISDNSGEVVYKNVSIGDYVIRMTSPEENLVPVDGIEQTYEVTGRTKLMIPFKRGKVIRGRINVVSDDDKKYTAEFIKLTATDANGKIYSTLTDVNGSFAFSVPGGVYKVSLNPAYVQSSGFIPDQMTYDVDMSKSSDETVTFTVRKKTRKIRYLKQ